MDIEIEKNARPAVNEPELTTSSNSGLQYGMGNELEFVDLETDRQSESNGRYIHDLPELESDSEDSTYLTKTELLKSLSDIDNIVLKNHSSSLSTDDMLMNYISKSNFQHESERTNSKKTFNLTEEEVNTNGSTTVTITNKDETDRERYNVVYLRK